MLTSIIVGIFVIIGMVLHLWAFSLNAIQGGQVAALGNGVLLIAVLLQLSAIRRKQAKKE